MVIDWMKIDWVMAVDLAMKIDWVMAVELVMAMDIVKSSKGNGLAYRNGNDDRFHDSNGDGYRQVLGMCL